MDELVTVRVSGGILRGRTSRTSSGLLFYSFQGIPYAEAPVGSLRFKPPQLVSPWDGVKDALKEGSMCSQMNTKGQYKGSEDCLYLNIYSPEISSGDDSDLKAVMVWIHGGGFTVGSGNSDRFGPDFLLERDVVVVTMNFRLGALGFLSTQDAILPGNLGLRDQLAALEWIKCNISHFNGNPNNVTIFGASSGGASVHYLILSPLVKGLFQRAISQSGTALIPGSFSRFSKERTFRLAEVLGCKTTNSQVLLDFLLKLAPEKLIAAQSLALSDEEKRRDVLFPFVPCVEPTLTDYDAFLPEEPEVLINKCSFSEVPYVVGVNSHEGIAFAKDVMENLTLQEEIENDFGRMIPLNMDTEINSQIGHEIAQEIKTFYFGASSLCEQTIEQFVNLKTDIRYAFAAHETVRLHGRYSSSPVYYYLFSYSGGLNSVKKHMKAEHLPGATHGDELNYLFSRTGSDITIQAEDRKIISQMVRMWTDFAKTGNPTPELNKEIPVLWPPFSSESEAYMSIDTELSVKHALFSDRMKFWTHMYNKFCVC